MLNICMLVFYVTEKQAKLKSNCEGIITNQKGVVEWKRKLVDSKKDILKH